MAKQKVQRIDFITLFFLAVAFFTALLPLRLSGTDRLNAGAEELTPDTNYWFEEARVEIDVNKDKTFSVAEKKERKKVSCKDFGHQSYSRRGSRKGYPRLL